MELQDLDKWKKNEKGEMMARKLERGGTLTFLFCAQEGCVCVCVFAAAVLAVVIIVLVCEFIHHQIPTSHVHLNYL